MTMPRKRVLLSDPYFEPEYGNDMQFRLTYSGKLYSTGNDSTQKGIRRADHKHDIRRYLHPQLKRLWQVVKFLKTGERGGPAVLMLQGDAGGDKPPVYQASYLAKKHALDSWNFVPLVTSDLDLVCGVDILFLRPQHPGGILKGQGDIDGRLKTLLDALAKPDANQRYTSRIPGTGENPLFVLLENDRLVTKLAVETDQLLERRLSDPNEVHLVITVTLRPYEMHLGNIQFG